MEVLTATLTRIWSIWNVILSAGRTYWTVKEGKSGTVQQYLNQAFSNCVAAGNILCAIWHANYTCNFHLYLVLYLCEETTDKCTVPTAIKNWQSQFWSFSSSETDNNFFILRHTTLIWNSMKSISIPCILFNSYPFLTCLITRCLSVFITPQCCSRYYKAALWVAWYRHLLYCGSSLSLQQSSSPGAPSLRSLKLNRQK